MNTIYRIYNQYIKGCYFDSRFVDEDFLENFRIDSRFQQRYELLKYAFCLGFDERFVIYDKAILSEEFLENFQFGMNNRWSSKTKLAFDPAVFPLISGCVLNDEDMMEIQKVLVAVNGRF